MRGEEQEHNFSQLLETLAYNATQLTSSLVSDVVESSPQLYVKTKIHLLSSIGVLSRQVVELQEAWNELIFHRKRAGLMFPEDSDKKHKDKGVKRTAYKASVTSQPLKRGRKKKSLMVKTFPSIDIPMPLEESIHEQIPTTTTDST
ncbi:hypothetical protein OS493_022337 [Desmophyllum pertusum]|uniref:Uncharacterized protein n=1 Tax=Desmophyllum pertusum TaxID=174260 RepID=A0A9X0DAB3_9CNID|nr:hypothetical protein OS493_022337 [Desmophyllum pertusum]